VQKKRSVLSLQINNNFCLDTTIDHGPEQSLQVRIFVVPVQYKHLDMTHQLHIKNMVCPRCISAVSAVFGQLEIPVKAIQLGAVTLTQEISPSEKKDLAALLMANGFELLEDYRSALISRIKSLIIDQVHHSEKDLQVNLSHFLAENLQHEYTYLSKLFSSVEGVTIEKFVMKQKIERAKELLFYNQLTLSEIAFKLDYSSAAHLSSHFKKETGMAPSAFRKLQGPWHRPLDTI
jgi:AraC-like DNA-binding protein